MIAQYNPEDIDDIIDFNHKHPKIDDWDEPTDGRWIMTKKTSKGAKRRYIGILKNKHIKYE